uniref:Family with sequence similarity 53 member B n=1 Tax=Gasterosteus aculeatus aculeatus TaxID=481459 RepID=A0AAQ4P4L9_GASAC
MCVAMVIIFKKTLEKKGADVTSKSTDLGPFQAQTMTQGTALFSCGLMETSRWRELGHSCAVQPRPVGTSLESLWDVLPEVHESSAHWDWDVGSTSTTITSLLRDLSLTEAGSSHSTAPPSKRQCRSLSCSEELAGCRSPWRPQGSRVWTAVVKRRCHSGGSVQRGGGGAAHAQPAFPAVQRSSSFSLPARANTPGALPCPPAFRGLTPSSSTTPPSEPSALPPYLSHEPICLPEPRGPSPASSPDSTPELERRGGVGLARSRSQPCVGVKRRRPALDLAKMSEVGYFVKKRITEVIKSNQENIHLIKHCNLCRLSSYCAYHDLMPRTNCHTVWAMSPPGKSYNLSWAIFQHFICHSFIG